MTGSLMFSSLRISSQFKSQRNTMMQSNRRSLCRDRTTLYTFQCNLIIMEMTVQITISNQDTTRVTRSPCWETSTCQIPVMQSYSKNKISTLQNQISIKIMIHPLMFCLALSSLNLSIFSQNKYLPTSNLMKLLGWLPCYSVKVPWWICLRWKMPKTLLLCHFQLIRIQKSALFCYSTMLWSKTLAKTTQWPVETNLNINLKRKRKCLPPGSTFKLTKASLLFTLPPTMETSP